MTHSTDVTRTANAFPYTAEFMFIGVRNNKTQQTRHRKINRKHLYVYSVAVYRLGEMIIFEPKLEKYRFSQPRWIFLINGNTIYV